MSETAQHGGKIAPQERSSTGGTVKEWNILDRVVRCRLAAVCYQTVVICGCLLDCVVAAAREKLADFKNRAG